MSAPAPAMKAFIIRTPYRATYQYVAARSVLPKFTYTVERKDAYRFATVEEAQHVIRARNTYVVGLDMANTDARFDIIPAEEDRD